MKTRLLFAFLLFTGIASAQRVTHKFVKVGVSFTYQADNGASIAPQQVTQSVVSQNNTFIRVFFNNAWYITILAADSVMINGSGVTGSLVAKRNQLLTDVFPSISSGGSGGSTTTGQLSADSVNDGTTKKAFLATERTAISTNTSNIALKANISDTAAMLTNYRTAATTNTSNIALKVSISDTSTMLTNYRNAINTNTANVATNTTAIAGKQGTLTNSAGLAGALSDETGTGLAVFATSPTLTTPSLGTPSAVVLTNGTGLPESGVTNLVSDLAAKQGSVTRQAISFGTNTTLTSQAADIWIVVNPGSTLATDTLKMPATPVDNQTVQFTFGGTVTSGDVVTALVIQPNTSQTIIGTVAFANVAVEDGIKYRWNATISKWHRITN